MAGIPVLCACVLNNLYVKRRLSRQGKGSEWEEPGRIWRGAGTCSSGRPSAGLTFHVSPARGLLEPAAALVPTQVGDQEWEEVGLGKPAQEHPSLPAHLSDTPTWDLRALPGESAPSSDLHLTCPWHRPWGWTLHCPSLAPPSTPGHTGLLSPLSLAQGPVQGGCP